MTDLPGLDEDELIACVDLIGRTGARGFEVGYLHDDVPIAEAGWYAHAQYRGARITAEDHPSPVAAAKALASRILTGAKCKGCGKLVALADDGAFAYFRSTLLDGTRWNAADAAAAGQCRWERVGKRWEMGCRPRGGHA